MASLTRAGVLTNYIEVAQHLGLNPHTMLRRVGLNKALIEQPEQRIPTVAVVTLLEDSARESGCMTFGLRMAESRQLSDFGAISLLLMHQPTLRDAIRTTVQYRHLLNEALAIHVEEVDRKVIIREEVVTDSPMASRQAIELAIGVMYRLCGALLGTHWRPYSVNFTHEAPQDLQLHRRLFRCHLGFGAEFNGIVCTATELDEPNPLADPALARFAQHYLDSLASAQERSVALDVRKAVYLLLPMGRASIEQIAEALGMNVRTLQRRLQEHDETFSSLINSVRRELVMRYMENEHYSMSQIADLLGYSMPSSFTRWFAAQFGVAPARWRASQATRNRR
ncbi:AraC family transcriptional regulator [Marinobacterium rhizophilum]|uniref:AraC family transcriptional regulator n=1 Tax=Marinobacterium rhizophilum TaxID=420402 RepID=A0ABY5HJB6_9GAMM|nr:AraC family transcriptional regulator [Marinobacterium rhizophilum]UTW12385.1 AraC family transcriptional regulator [Marinobacterium rhizophilum]